MLQIPQDQRLAYISAVINEEKIRFPKATFAKETNQDSGNISKMLDGKLAVSDKFFTAFLQHHPKVPDAWVMEQQAMPNGGLKRTLKDYVEHIEGENKFLKGLVNSALSDIAVTIKELVSERLSSVESGKLSETVEEEQDEHSDLLLPPTFGGKSIIRDRQNEQGNTPAKGI